MDGRRREEEGETSRRGRWIVSMPRDRATTFTVKVSDYGRGEQENADHIARTANTCEFRISRERTVEGMRTVDIRLVGAIRPVSMMGLVHSCTLG